ncbi:hypothetical protein JW859_14095 [bacterium]|nr:hypothetical protein [bacterium]
MHSADMKKGIWVYIIIVVVASILLAAAAAAVQATNKQMAGLVFLPLIAVPLIAAYIGHRVSGAIGNPFRGLVFGGGGAIVGIWLLSMLIGALVVALSIGLRLQTIDLTMHDYIQSQADAVKATGQPVAANMMKSFRFIGMFTAILMPTIIVWIIAAFTCLQTFPWYGWLTRRLLVHGYPATFGILAVLFMISGAIGGVIENPQLGDAGMPLRMAILAVSTVAYLPGLLWLFFKTRSAVIPALAQAGFVSAQTAALPYLTNGEPLLSPPAGALPIAVALLLGIGLWIWQDPKGQQLAVAAVAHDGQPLTPEMLQRLEEEEHRWETQHGESTPAAAEPAVAEAPELPEEPEPPAGS